MWAAHCTHFTVGPETAPGLGRAGLLCVGAATAARRPVGPERNGTLRDASHQMDAPSHVAAVGRTGTTPCLSCGRRVARTAWCASKVWHLTSLPGLPAPAHASTAERGEGEARRVYRHQHSARSRWRRLASTFGTGARTPTQSTRRTCASSRAFKSLDVVKTSFLKSALRETKHTPLARCVYI